MKELEGVLREFFLATDADFVHASLHMLEHDAELGRLALLPRADLAQRACEAGQLHSLTQGVWQAITAEWGDDPDAWPVSNVVRCALGDLLAAHFAMQRQDHSSETGVQPASAPQPAPRPRRRGRTGT